MGDIIKKKLFQYLIVSTVCLLFVIIYSVFTVMQWQKNMGFDERNIRIDVNSVIYKVEAADYTNIHTLESVSSIPFTLVGLDGTVMYTQSADYHAGQLLDLHTLSSINPSSHEYRVPVSKDGKQFGMLLIDVDNGAYRRPLSHFILLISPIILFGTIQAFCCFFIIRILKEDVFRPLKLLHKATQAIMEGNLDSPLTYDYDGGIGTLCHDFELMRSELQNSSLREQSYKEKETLLLASISHDLKTPLASITGYVEGILCDVVEEKEDIKNYAEIILHKANSINRLIDDILEHSKAHLNQFTIQKEEVYAAPYFGNLLRDLSQDADQKGFEFRYGPIPNVLLSLDTGRIAQVMRNITDNSIKYGKAGGEILVSFQLIEHFLIIAVKDNGMGIAAADLPFIFDTFYRGDKARTQRITGSGLGLNIVKYIAQKHGGTVECDSILGVGTTITFSLAL